MINKLIAAMIISTLPFLYLILLIEVVKSGSSWGVFAVVVIPFYVALVYTLYGEVKNGK